MSNAAQNVTVKNKIEKAGFEFSKVWLGMEANVADIKNENLQAWKEGNTISVSLKRIDPETNAEDKAFTPLTYEINSSGITFQPTNTGIDRDKYTLTKSVKGNIITFTLPNVLDAVNSNSKPYIYYAVETAAGTGMFTTYYGKIENDSVKIEEASQRAENGEVIINQEVVTIELPATGGMGTGVFGLLGAMLTLGAGLLLWRRRKTIEGKR